MLDHTADIVQCGFRQAAVAITREQVDAILSERHMNVHPITVVTNQWLGHEGGSFTVAMRNVMDTILENLYLVGLFNQGIKGHANFALTGSRDLVMVYFDFKPHFFHGQAHRGTHIVQRIDRRHRKITTLDTRAMACVSIFVCFTRVPVGFFRIDFVRRVAHLGGPAHIVKNKKFILRTKVGNVGDSRGFQIGFCTIGDRTWITFIAFAGGRFDNIAGNVNRGFIGKWVQYRGAGIGHQDHVGFVNAFPA